MQKSETSGNRLRLAVGAIGIVYLLQILTPFRLDNDSVVYLRLGIDIASGTWPQRAGLPLGYPIFTGTLDRLGIHWSFVFVLANCIFFAAGLNALWYVFVRGRPESSWWIIVIAMLCYLPIKFVTMSLPETLFFGTSLTTLALLSEAWVSTGSRRFALLCASVVMIGVSIAVRLVGCALIPPLVMCCCFRPSQGAKLDTRHFRPRWGGPDCRGRVRAHFRKVRRGGVVSVLVVRRVDVHARPFRQSRY